jgi:hypothetical protein
MSLLRVGQSVSIILLCIFSHLAEAKDISTLQTALALAREDMEKAKDKHDASAQAVVQQQRIVAERKKQLADENRQLDKIQKDTKKAFEQYLKAKKKYEKTQSAFDAAWDKK